VIAGGETMDSHVIMRNDNNEVGSTAWLYATMKLEVGIALVIAEVSGRCGRVGRSNYWLK
jgi:hypothetical protein